MNVTTMKVLIVDDEPMARRRIRSFHLEENGFEITGEAENGEQAWRMIKDLQPDIVVADIGMPVLNGLDLLKRTGDLLVAPKFILLTCYEDFEKIQIALRYGAFDYMTKLLLKEKEFITCLNKAADLIRQERQHTQNAVRQLLLDLLILGSEAKSSLEQLRQLLFPCRQYQLALIRFNPENTKVMSRTVSIFEASEGYYMSWILQVEPGLWAVLFSSSENGGGSGFYSWVSRILQCGHDACKTCGTLTMLTTTDIRSDLLQLSQAFEECRSLMYDAFYQPAGLTVTSQTTQQGMEFPPNRFEVLQRECRHATDQGDSGEAAKRMMMWLDESENIYRPEPGQLLQMGVVLAGCLNDDYSWREEGKTVLLREWLKARIESSMHMSEVRKAITKVVEQLQEERISVRGVRSEIRKAVRFIEERYQEEIDLPTAARKVNLSPSWFGTLFRNEIGHSFFDYLQDYRLEQGKILLMNSDLKIYEIAALVGIPNSRYFSRLFTLKYQATPQDYRSKIRSERNC